MLWARNIWKRSWRDALERRGTTVNRRKTEYMCVNERRDNETVRMQMRWRKWMISWFSSGVIRTDKIGNEHIRGTAQVGRFGEKTREAGLRWCGHARRKDDGYIGRRMLRMELPGKRKRGRPKRRFMDVVKEDMAVVEVTEEDAEDRTEWRWKIRCGDLPRENPNEEEEEYLQWCYVLSFPSEKEFVTPALML